jgi:hypothetical protein
MTYEYIVAWAAVIGLSPEEGETEADFRERFAHQLLCDYNDPVAARQVTLDKEPSQWTLLERAAFVLDYHSFFEGPEGFRHSGWSIYQWCRSTAGHKTQVVMLLRTRSAGAVASNPAEFLNAEGQRGDDEYANWEGIFPHWEGPKLKDAPRGFEEALAKRQAFPLDDLAQGALVVRHFDKDGKQEVKFIQPKEPAVKVAPDSRRLAQSTDDAEPDAEPGEEDQ